MKLTIEIRAAEGGDDAALLVAEQAKIYRAFGARHDIEIRDIESVSAAVG